jgi:hypothetical protein
MSLSNVTVQIEVPHKLRCGTLGLQPVTLLWDFWKLRKVGPGWRK